MTIYPQLRGFHLFRIRNFNPILHGRRDSTNLYNVRILKTYHALQFVRSRFRDGGSLSSLFTTITQFAVFGNLNVTFFPPFTSI